MEQDLLDLLQHPASLAAVRTGANSKLIGRSWNVQFCEEDLRHITVVVLPSVNYALFDLWPASQSSRNHASFYKLGTSTNHGHDSQSLASSLNLPTLGLITASAVR